MTTPHTLRFERGPDGHPRAVLVLRRGAGHTTSVTLTGDDVTFATLADQLAAARRRRNRPAFLFWWAAVALQGLGAGWALADGLRVGEAALRFMALSFAYGFARRWRWSS